ncbi:MAG: ABC transporter ATP-binding protein [Anaerolineaceae bacterium]
MSVNLLSFDHVAFGYSQARPIFSDLNYQLRRGTLSVILGPNGIGKTTLLYMALGWLQPSAGQVLLENRPLQVYSRAELGRRVSLVPQTERQPYSYTVLEYVLFGRAPHLALFGAPGENDELAARQALARAGIPELAGAYVDQLSGGEGQLVLIARALAQEPRVLLLDEPSAHLDLGNKFRLMQTLSDLRRDGTTILMTTHDPEIALAVSDETVLVDGSGSVTVGTPTDLLTADKLSQLYHLPVGALEIRPSHPGVTLRRF